MDWFLYDNGLRHERVKFVHWTIHTIILEAESTFLFPLLLILYLNIPKFLFSPMLYNHPLT